MNWFIFVLVICFMSITANGFMVYLIRQVAKSNDPVIDEVRGANEILRGENKDLHERIEMMAASTPHIRLVGKDEETYESSQSLNVTDDDGTKVDRKGAGVV